MEGAGGACWVHGWRTEVGQGQFCGKEGRAKFSDHTLSFIRGLRT